MPQLGCENDCLVLTNLLVFQHMNACSTYVDNSTSVTVQIHKNYLQQPLQEQEPLMGTLLFNELGVKLQLRGGEVQESVELLRLEMHI